MFRLKIQTLSKVGRKSCATLLRLATSTSLPSLLFLSLVDRWYRDGHCGRLLRLPDIPSWTHCGVQFCVCSQRLAIDLCDRFHGTSETTIRVSSSLLPLLSSFLSLHFPHSSPSLRRRLLCRLFPFVSLARALSALSLSPITHLSPSPAPFVLSLLPQ